MGRPRKIFTKKMLNALFRESKSYQEETTNKKTRAHTVFYILTVILFAFGLLNLAVSYKEGMIAFFVLGAFSLFIAVVAHIASKIEPSDYLEQETASNNSSHTVKTVTKPVFDFFCENAEIDTEYIKQLLKAHSIIPKPYFSPYDGMETERLLYVDYNEKTHSAKATYEVTKYYRTVERYVQQNYQRTPIYSALKSKVKQYTKTYKLTNKNLENLHNEFSYSNQHLYLDLIVALNNPLLVPYQFFLLALGKQLEIAINYNEYLIKDAEKTHENLKFDAESKIKILFSKIELTNKPLEKLRSKLGKLKAKFEKKPSPKLENKIIEIEDAISEVVSFVSESQKEIGKLQKDVSISENSTKAKTNDIKDHIKQTRDTYHSLLKKFKPLQIEATDANDFTPLNALSGMEYTKIIGCYVLRNTENNRCYVGQSKDVIKRLKQHFKGTVPHNVIFAEDYYSSKVTDKEWLFEFKIIPCGTKDELDQTEKLLIEEYEAFTNGYNGTHGNS